MIAQPRRLCALLYGLLLCPAAAHAQIRSFSTVFNPSVVTPPIQMALHNLGLWAQQFRGDDPAVKDFAFLASYLDPQNPDPAKLAALSPWVQAMEPVLAAPGTDFVAQLNRIPDLKKEERERALSSMQTAARTGTEEAANAYGSGTRQAQQPGPAGGRAEGAQLMGPVGAELQALMDQGMYRGRSKDILTHYIGTASRELSPKTGGTIKVGRQMVYDSEPMRALSGRMTKFAGNPATVLIQGESGTGKELVARGIHEQSQVKGGVFVPINLAAVPEALLTSTLFGHKKGAFTGADKDEPGAIKKASGGTLFLDEIGELPLSVQAGLLRFLQEGEIQPVGRAPETLPKPPRLVASTNRDLTAEVQAGRFRSDLYYRLNVLPLRTPPLRDRRSDILPLAGHFLEKYRTGAAPKRLSPASEKTLAEHSWPGNVRELENVIQRAIVLAESDTIEPGDLLIEDASAPAAAVPAPASAQDIRTLDELLRAYITAAYRSVPLSMRQLAERLGISVKTLKSRLREYGLLEEAAAPETDE